MGVADKLHIGLEGANPCDGGVGVAFPPSRGAVSCVEVSVAYREVGVAYNGGHPCNTGACHSASEWVALSEWVGVEWVEVLQMLLPLEPPLHVTEVSLVLSSWGHSSSFSSDPRNAQI